MKFADTTATRKIFEMSERIRVVGGGTAASKTISIMVWGIDWAQTSKNKLMTVVSESYPHLEKGVMLDFENIMKAHGYWKDSQWNKTKHVYTFESGSKIEFFSVDTYGKAHGPRRDVLFINECNNLPYNIVDQLITRTREIIWLDFNPISEFWYHTELKDRRDDVEYLKLTYLDNEALDETTIKEIESHKHKKGWWTVYGLGELGEIEERIYKGWKQLDEIPPEARLERRYIDFGYTNDPTAIGDVYYWNGSYILDERIYQKELSNKAIAESLLQMPRILTIADSAEPKSIAEIQSFGLNIVASKKGKDSIYHGIQSVQDQQIYVTKRSHNIWKEYMNYVFIKDKNDKVLNDTDPACADHHMDGIRYAVTSLVPVMRKREFAYNIPDFITKKRPNRAR
jgi:phage terminase large subunit